MTCNKLGDNLHVRFIGRVYTVKILSETLLSFWPSGKNFWRIFEVSAKNNHQFSHLEFRVPVGSQ